MKNQIETVGDSEGGSGNDDKVANDDRNDDTDATGNAGNACNARQRRCRQLRWRR